MKKFFDVSLIMLAMFAAVAAPFLAKGGLVVVWPLTVLFIVTGVILWALSAREWRMED